MIIKGYVVRDRSGKFVSDFTRSGNCLEGGSCEFVTDFSDADKYCAESSAKLVKENLKIKGLRVVPIQ